MFYFKKDSNRCVKSCSAKSIDVNMSTTVKSHFKALGLYNFKRGFGWAYKRGGGGREGLYPEGLISGVKKNVWERPDKTYLRNELKLKYHYILS